MSVSLVHFAQLLTISVVFVSGCFITNCPPGGKRSDSEEKTHQCEQCGPPGLDGRCYGPQICCSPQFGCLVGSQVTAQCRQETRSPSLCHNQGIGCDGSAETGPINGQCASPGVCCTPETCTLDEDCSSPDMLDNGKGRQLEDGENIVVPLHHIAPPIDLTFYRRLIHSKGSRHQQGPGGGGVNSESLGMEVVPVSSSSLPQGPPIYFPHGSRRADYF